MEVIEQITLEEVREVRAARIYYSSRTCWWTHDPAHLCRHPQAGIPCDPRGAPLFETDDAEGFLRRAEQIPEHYGRHGLRAFMAAHHLNAVVGVSDLRATCGTEWEEYNAALDRLDARKGAESE